MREPYIFLYVADGALHVGKKLPTESEPRELFDVSVDQVVASEFDEAARKLGATVLGVLKLWHKDSFQSWGQTADALSSPSSDDFEVALSLIDRLAGGGSEDRLKLIDEILSDAATVDAAARSYLHDDWPPLRKRLLRK
jgi:hypothetical protein